LKRLHKALGGVLVYILSGLLRVYNRANKATGVTGMRNQCVVNYKVDVDTTPEVCGSQ